MFMYQTKTQTNSKKLRAGLIAELKKLEKKAKKMLVVGTVMMTDKELQEYVVKCEQLYGWGY